MIVETALADLIKIWKDSKMFHLQPRCVDISRCDVQYVCESLSVRKQKRKKLDVFEMKCWTSTVIVTSACVTNRAYDSNRNITENIYCQSLDSDLS